MVCCYISFIYTLSTGNRQQTNYYGVFDKLTNFSCNEKCSDESRLYAGDIEGKPGENFMEGENVQIPSCLDVQSSPREVVGSLLPCRSWIVETDLLILQQRGGHTKAKSLQ